MRKIEILQINTTYDGTMYITILFMKWYSIDINTLKLMPFLPKLKKLTCESLTLLDHKVISKPCFIAG
jgi:hypothetical protein